jgi:hypothetical protein
MATKNWMAQLQKHEDAIIKRTDPHSKVIRTPSPSINYCFGKGHGLPQGYSMVISGHPKGGKSVLSYAMVGQLHADDPEAYALKIDTEYREIGQLPDNTNMYGIDMNRYQAYSTNVPSKIFNYITGDVNAMCQDGFPLRLIIIDSLTNIGGRRSLDANDIDQNQIGDEAKTHGDGIKLILPVLKKHNISIIYTTHIQTELDPLEIRRGNKLRMSFPFKARHLVDYFTFIEANRNKEGKTDLGGNEFKSETISDAMGNAEQMAHKIRLKMLDSSLGPKGRVGEFTFDYDKGIINTFEEAFLLGINTGVIERPNNLTYVFGNNKWTGKPATLEALEGSPELCDAIVKEVFKRDSNKSEDNVEFTSENVE